MKKVRKGEDVEISASTWNAFIDAANYVQNRRSNMQVPASGAQHRDGTVFVKNLTGVPRERFTAIALGEMLLDTEQEDSAFPGSTPVFAGEKVALEESPDQVYAILLEPLAVNGIGRAMVLGVVPARVDIEDSEHWYAEPVDGDAYGTMQSCESGTARIIWKAGEGTDVWCVLQLGGTGSGGGGARLPSYNGYFTIKDTSTYGDDGTLEQAKVTVADGKTWNGKTCQNMPYVVNNSWFSISPWSTTSISTIEKNIYLVYDDDSGKGHFEITSDDTEEYDTVTVRYLIGTVYRKDNAVKIIQRHGEVGVSLLEGGEAETVTGILNGVPYMYLFTNCFG